jgi:transcriptional regulator with XRE-family HTH domain
LVWRQSDVASRAGLSQDSVSRAERGRIAEMSVAHLESIAKALDAELVVSLRWRGGELDRLIDEGHAALMSYVAAWLGRLGWEVRAEVTYSRWGERGSIDVLALHEATATLLVVEVKTELVSLEETIRRHDAKTRLAPQIATEQLGWRPKTIGRLLVIADTATQRRRVDRVDEVLRRTHPVRGAAARQWMRLPVPGFSGLIFVGPRLGNRSRRRITANSR